MRVLVKRTSVRNMSNALSALHWAHFLVWFSGTTPHLQGRRTCDGSSFFDTIKIMENRANEKCVPCKGEKVRGTFARPCLIFYEAKPM